jgi:hypothetical protein
MKPSSTKFICASAVGASTVTASIDTRGFSYCQIVGFNSAAAGLHTTAANTILQESDDDSSWTTITTGLTPLTTASAASIAKVVWNVDLRGRKRYLKPTTGYAATNSLSLIAVLHNGADAPNTAGEVNAVNVANI